MERTSSPFKKTGKQVTCNICLQTFEKLTEEHTPNRAIQPYLDVQIYDFLHSFLPSDFKSDSRPPFYTSRTGLHFSTTCSTCNNTVLSKYDKVLTNFTKSIKDKLSTINRFKNTVLFSYRVSSKLQTSLASRSILGHLLAMYVDNWKSIFDELIRPCVLDETVPIPDTISIYYWFYPYKPMVLFRDVVIPASQNMRDLAFVQLFKFYPIAYLVCDKPYFHNLPKLNLSLEIDEVEEIAINRNNPLPVIFPEMPNDMLNTFLLMGGAPAFIINTKDYPIEHFKQMQKAQEKTK